LAFFVLLISDLFNDSAQNILRPETVLLIGKGMEGSVMAYVRYYPGVCAEVLRKIMKALSQDSRVRAKI
jgi:hypothetical protein